MRNYFFKEIKLLANILYSWAILFLILTIFFFTFKIEIIRINDISLPLPMPTIDSISSQLLKKIQADLVPKEIKVIVTSPLSAFFSQLNVSLFLAFIFSFPYFLFKFSSYLSPALYKKEKKMIIKALFPSVILFLIGCSFGYFILAPLTIKFLYLFAIAMDVTTFFELSEFISLSLLLIFSSGIVFLLPIFMLGLTSLKIVDKKFWIRNWRYALIAILIFCAIITPDGTGVTMLILALPLIALYLIGCYLAKR